MIPLSKRKDKTNWVQDEETEENEEQYLFKIKKIQFKTLKTNRWIKGKRRCDKKMPQS